MCLDGLLPKHSIHRRFACLAGRPKASLTPCIAGGVAWKAFLQGRATGCIIGDALQGRTVAIQHLIQCTDQSYDYRLRNEAKGTVAFT